MQKEVKQTLLAKVYDVAEVTPLQIANKLSNTLGANVYLKREDLQPVHSFKLRGAYNKIANLNQKELSKGVIASSAGNHAQGVALAAKKLKTNALIIMPKTTPPIKVDAVRTLGADVELYGDSYSDAADYCKKLVKKTGRIYIHPFDDPMVIAGQGTVGREIIEQLPDTTHIFVPIGGGGLIAGIALYVKSIRPDIKIIGVEPSDSNAMQRSIKQNRRVTLDHVGIFADGVAVKQVGEHTFRAAAKFVDEIVTVDTDQVCAAIKQIFEDTRSIVEPAGALAVAGISEYAKSKDITGTKLVAINSGANMTFERLQFIAERTLLGSNKEALYAIDMPESPGALQSFCNYIVSEHNISQFAYRLNNRDNATICVGIGVKDQADKKVFEDKMIAKEYSFIDLTLDDIAKEHIRHMIGGPASKALNEHFYHIAFPERPGALGEFLKAVSGKYNISLFHYRGQGGDEGYVMIGFESADRTSLEVDLTKSGYSWKAIGDYKSVKTFIV